ncbi:hypothetical protein FITA111629_01485 [Filibacter tadaridae]|uniref:DUF2268 domain-containing protein n=1 Tax=Filibacter tadaridae TaxID=2483811 RepID=A0A3P5XHD3_9BACL|nr:hypothetical protein [Filibacter tadaridae]VDC29553.1 hypothetical protein FILTAD_02144 [Filibacter tadaridae]
MDNVEVMDLVPKFLNFYKLANKDGIEEDARWTMWKELYNFAAVPPGEEGQTVAKKLLNDAWDKYEQNLSVIEKWTPDEGKIQTYLTKVKALLGCDQPINFVVIYFVGGFENNPFVAPFDKERLALCLPIENGDSDIYLVHELTHIVHSQTAQLTGEWERTIASTILQEGLATQVSKFVVPGEPDELYIEHKKGWFQSCKKHRSEIFTGITPFLNESSSEIVTKFTFGNGTTNHEREAYFVGWEVVQSLLEKGVTFKEIAVIKEGHIPDYLNHSIATLCV